MRRNPVCERGSDESNPRKAALWDGNGIQAPSAGSRDCQNSLGACPAPDTVPFNPYINPHLQHASHCCCCSKPIYWQRSKHSWSKLAPVSLFKQHLLPHQLHLTKSCPVFKSHFKHYLSEDLPIQFSELFFPTFTLPQLSPTWTHTVSQLFLHLCKVCC